MKIFSSDFLAKFIDRPNRFIIIADLNGEKVICHCPNTGRMGELLFPGVKLILEKSTNVNRKTKYSVVAVFKGDLVVPITSVRANNVAENIIIPSLFKNPIIKSEVTYKKSRFDFYVEDCNIKTFIEVKSCTLFIGDEAIFPDAPTSRGVKHMKELYDATQNGFNGIVILVVFNPASTSFSPNNITDPLFSKTLKEVSSRVKIIPYKVGVDSEGNLFQPEGDPILPIIFKGELND